MHPMTQKSGMYLLSVSVGFSQGNNLPVMTIGRSRTSYKCLNWAASPISCNGSEVHCFDLLQGIEV